MNKRKRNNCIKKRRKTLRKINNKYKETNIFWTIQSVKNKPNILYLFSDNDKDKNTNIPGGNQAVIRGLKNAFGIRTGYSGGYSGGFRDDKLEYNKKMIKDDLKTLKRISKKYKKIVYSSQGFGTGIFNLPNVAPLTYKYLYDQLWKIGIRPSKGVKPI